LETVMTDAPHARRWWALAALTLAIVAFDLNLTTVNVALPILATELDATSAQLQWFPNAYMLMVAAALLPAGLLGDRFGPKRPLITALVVLGVAAVLCSLATSPGMLIAGQGLLGLAAGFVPALSLALVNVLFPAAERARALAVLSAGLTLGIPLGPVVGGALLAHFWWGSIFLVNVPLVAVGAAMIAVLVPRTPGVAGPRPDLVGLALSCTGLVALTFGLVEVGERGWGSAAGLGALGAAVVALALVVPWTRAVSDPVVDPDLFRSRGFTGGLLLSTVVTFALMGAMFTLPQYFQAVLGSGPLGTGLRLMPVVAGLLAGVVIAGPVRRGFGAKAVVAAGLATLAVAAAIGSTTSADTGYAFVAGWMMLAGIGAGLSLPATMDVAMGSLTHGRTGVGSAVIQAFRQVGGTLGVTLLGTALAIRYRTAVDVSGLPDETARDVRRTAASGVGVAGETGSPVLLESVREAFVLGMSTTLWITAAVAAAGVLLAVVLLPGGAEDEVAARGRAPVAP
jgi:EmrB/QacA subfamily drug resistance transporter